MAHIRDTTLGPRLQIALREGRFSSSRRYATLAALFATFLFLVSPSAEATIYTAASPSLSDVTAKVNIAADGDTVVIPPGTASWSTVLTITHAIILQGAGIGNTIIKDSGSSAPIMNWTLVSGKASRMTGIQFQNNGRTAAASLINSFGSNTNGSTFRVDHCKFDHLNGFPLVPSDTIGVFDHNTFLTTTGISIYVYHKNWNNQGPLAGGSWHDSSHFGTSQFLFVEDNTFTADPGAGGAAFDCYGGARIVFRYNNVTRCHCEIHGTEAGIFRGGRAFEIYNNTFTGVTGGNYIINGRSGIFVIHDNQVTGNVGANFALVNYRTPQADAPWGQADGTTVWDVNATEADGTNVPGHAPYLFYSGTASSGTPNGGSYSFPTVVVSGSPWTPNQWKGYSIHKTSTEVSPQKGSYILENTANSITFLPSLNYANMKFASGDTFQLYKVLQAMDQPGRSQGTLLSQTDPPPVPSGWNDQVTEPCYEWANVTTEGPAVHFSSSPYDSLIRANEHYFNSTVKPGYTPFTYPHPLTAGSSQPNPPANLRITGQ